MKVSHPMQPVQRDALGTIRFKKNAIVRFLVDWAAGKNGAPGYPHLATPGNKAPDLNVLSLMDFTKEDWTQVAQLLGYSVSGAGDLSYFNRRVLAQADAAAEALMRKRRRQTRARRKRL